MHMLRGRTRHAKTPCPQPDGTSYTALCVRLSFRPFRAIFPPHNPISANWGLRTLRCVYALVFGHFGHFSATSGHFSATSGHFSATSGHLSATSGHFSATSGYFSTTSGTFGYFGHFRLLRVIFRLLRVIFRLLRAMYTPVRVPQGPCTPTGMYMEGHPFRKSLPPNREYAFWVSSHAQGYHPLEIPQVPPPFY
jgi:hypothetical protein